ncbi:PAS domain-containing protein [Lacunimicrobium album]
MPPAALPDNEARRLEILRLCSILDTPPEPIFDDLTSLAATLCDVPISVISLVDVDRQWFKSAHGFDIRETSRDVAICAHVVMRNAPLIINDTLLDPLTSDNPIVLSGPKIRFYAGFPLTTSENLPLGTLCVVDRQPRKLTDIQIGHLASLARQASALLELRYSLQSLQDEKRTVSAAHNRLVHIAAQVPGLVYKFVLRPDGTACMPYASDRIKEIYRVTPEEVTEDASIVFKVIHPEDRARVIDSVQASARDLTPWRLTYRVRFDDGEVRWLSGESTPQRLADRSVLWHGFITDVTDQVAQKQDSDRNRSHLHAVINASTEISIIATDDHGVISVFNTGAEKMLGYQSSEIVGKQTPEIFHLASEINSYAAELSKELGRPIEGALALTEYARQGNHHARDWTFVRKDGTHFTAHLVVTAIRDNEGQIMGYVGIATDVSVAAEAKRQLHTERERLDLALDSADIGSWDWDLKTGVVILDERWAEIAGQTFPDNQVHIDLWTSRIHPEDTDRVWQSLQDHFADQSREYDVVYRLQHASGNYRWIHGRGRVVERGVDYTPLRMAGICFDITQRIEAEKKIETANELLRQFITHTPAAVAMLDKDMRYLQTSTRWLEDYKLGATDVVGKSHYEIFPDIPQRWKQIHQDVLAGQIHRCDEDPFERADGTTEWLQWEAHPWYDTTGEVGGLIFFTQVITDRKHEEEELIHARLQAEQASLAKSNFLANMSHEIRTPLTAILGYTDILLDGSPSLSTQKSHLQTIKRSGDHLLTIINDILDLSKIEAGRMTIEKLRFSPAEIVQEVLANFKERAAQKNLQLSARCLGPVPQTILADPVRVRQILINLLGNAIKFTTQGRVELTVRYVPSLGDEPIRLAFDVTDTGLGIAPDQQAHLFQPFVQADNSMTRRFGGTGLGLAISRRMAQLLDGDVTLHSKPGEGSTFTATIATGSLQGIPFVNTLDLTTPVPAPQSASQFPLDGHILLAEDSPENHRLIKMLLTKAGATVDVVENGQLAIDTFMTAAPGTYQLIIMDVQMPILDGISATSKLRSLGVTHPILALTANAMAEDRTRCLNAGFTDFLTKPLDRQKLIQTCHHYLEAAKPLAVAQ